ncbi:hypothetical protein PWT90_01420 [Aphanocladium album]|nr:hypothetical protein PWT90_01420 [Aphanocladium album]
MASARGNVNEQLVHQGPFAWMGEALFYLTVRVHGIHRPLAVVSRYAIVQQPTRLDSLLAKTRRIVEALSRRDVDHRCRLHAELDAARLLYRHGRNNNNNDDDGEEEEEEPLREPPGAMTPMEQIEHLLNPLHAKFPYAARTLLDCVTRAGRTGTGGRGGLVLRRRRAKEWWRHVALNTGFGRQEETKYVAVVVDVTDLDSIRCGVVGRFSDGRLWRRQVVSVPGYCRLVCQREVNDARPLDVAGLAVFPSLSVVDDGVLQMLCDTCEPPKPTRRALALQDMSTGALIRAAETTPEFAPHVLGRARRLLSFAADLRKLLPDYASDACQPGAMTQLLTVAFAGCQDVRLVGMRGISCRVLVDVLAGEGLQSVQTLSFAADALEYDVALDDLARVLAELPRLASVYVAATEASPTEESRIEMETLQRLLVVGVQREGGTRMAGMMHCSAFYASVLAGRPALDLDSEGLR